MLRRNNNLLGIIMDIITLISPNKLTGVANLRRILTLQVLLSYCTLLL